MHSLPFLYKTLYMRLCVAEQLLIHCVFSLIATYSVALKSNNYIQPAIKQWRSHTRADQGFSPGNLHF